MVLLRTVKDINLFKKNLYTRSDFPLIFENETIVTYFPIKVEKHVIDETKNIYEYRYVFIKKTIAIIDHEIWEKHGFEFL